MLNPSRACCCVASPCACDPVFQAYLPVTGSQFIYEIVFPGSTGVVQVDARCNDVQIVVGDVQPGGPEDGEYWGLWCMNETYVNAFGQSSNKPCTTIPGTDCCEPGDPYGACNQDDPTPFVASNAFIQDIGVERETTLCGFDLNNQTALVIYADLGPYPNYCSYHEINSCSPGDPLGDCGLLGLFPCIKTYSANKCRLIGGDSVSEYFQFKGPYYCHPWQINSTRVQGGLSVEPPYSSAGTLRFTWAGASSGSGWVASLTSSTNGPDGNPTISTVGCAYRHRTRANTVCATADGPTSGSCSGTTMAASAGCGACTFTDCCCQTEVQIQFKVWQRYYTMGWTSQTAYGTLTGPTSVSSTITAYYRGCHDPRLYSTSTSAGSTRVLTLDRATISLGSVPLISAIQYRKSPGVTIENGTDCIAWSLYTEADPAAVYSLSTVEDSTACTCTTPGGCNSITREAAIARGVPDEIVITRITP